MGIQTEFGRNGNAGADPHNRRDPCLFCLGEAKIMLFQSAPSLRQNPCAACEVSCISSGRQRSSRARRGKTTCSARYAASTRHQRANRPMTKTLPRSCEAVALSRKCVLLRMTAEENSEDLAALPKATSLASAYKWRMNYPRLHRAPRSARAPCPVAGCWRLVLDEPTRV